FGIAFLGRARTTVVAEAKEVDRFSLAAMLGFVVLCVLAGLLPGFVIDAIAPAAELLVGARLPVQATVPWLSIVPVAEARSSYNGLLVFAFIAASAAFVVVLIHRFASRSIRRAPPWDCGFPDSNPI